MKQVPDSVASFQTPYTRFLTCFFSMIRKWIGRIPINFTDHLQTKTNSQVFLGMLAHAQAVDTRPSFLLPRGLGTRLLVATYVCCGSPPVKQRPLIYAYPTNDLRRNRSTYMSPVVAELFLLLRMCCVCRVWERTIQLRSGVNEWKKVTFYNLAKVAFDTVPQWIWHHWVSVDFMEFNIWVLGCRWVKTCSMNGFSPQSGECPVEASRAN